MRVTSVDLLGAARGRQEPPSRVSDPTFRPGAGHQDSCGPEMAQNGPKMAPKMAQEGPKKAPRGPKTARRKCHE